MIFIIISLVVNVLVAGYMGLALGFRLYRILPRMDQVFGSDTVARQILACFYLAIAVFSITALVNTDFLLRIALILFPLQIFYKILTVFLVKEKNNPVPKFNLAISVLHSVSLYFVLTKI